MNRLTKSSVVAFILVLFSCEDNNANEEPLREFGSISGTITFIGTWPSDPDSISEVLITLDTNYPPMGPPAGFKYVTRADLENNIYSYSFGELSFRDYDAVTVTYWPEGYVSAGTNYSLIGSHIETINVTQDEADITIDIEATFN